MKYTTKHSSSLIIGNLYLRTSLDDIHYTVGINVPEGWEKSILQ